ncbi:hypothetical protein [Microbulbifer hydrolyticus]|uniref:Uncharacterized protein n=1 Tax=Microbulbifer hydrolyticus TaxID=48074 RepID=A0A6P1T8X4_9GAMM|nr:hypothetical protein [Microbulbifer hydrolyticus]MBB5210241.1 hypothetical protein [Microbulbifer hydrolyticus]QHQ39254.1 hypothetical protein GTQ55_09825 [Microbulbifer hydrolyticus]
MAGIVMADMYLRAQARGTAKPGLYFLLLSTLLLLPAEVLHARQDSDISAAALESGRKVVAVESSSEGLAPPGIKPGAVIEKVDDAVYSRIHNSELVARVKITGVHRMVDNALSEPGMVAILGYVYSGVAQKVWKGESSNLIAFRLTLDDCDHKLKRGAQYLIFAESDTRGRLQLSSCEAAIEDAEAASLLVQLDRYYQG